MLYQIEAHVIIPEFRSRANDSDETSSIVSQQQQQQGVTQSCIQAHQSRVFMNLYGPEYSSSSSSCSRTVHGLPNWDLLYDGASTFAPAATSFLYLPNDQSSMQSLVDSDDEYQFNLQQLKGRGSTTACCSITCTTAAATPVMHPNLVSTLKHMVITPVRVDDDLNMAPGSSGPSSLYHQMSNATIFMSSAAAPAIDQRDSHDLLPNIGTSCGFFDCALQLHSDEITNNIIIPENRMIDLLQLQHDTDHDHTGNACTTTTASSSKLISTTDHKHAEREITMLVKQQQPEQLVHDSSKSLESFGDEAALVLADPAGLMKKKSMQQLHKTMRSSSSSSSSSQLPSTKGGGGGDGGGGGGQTVKKKKIPCGCPKCKKTFVGLYELRRHYGRKHSEGDKPFCCRKCDKKFYIQVDVRDHQKLCGEPVECCKCGLKFAFKCNLVAHNKKAHPPAAACS